MLNTFVTISLYEGGDEAVLDGCLKLCAQYEDMLSKTREGSEIYKLNHRAPGERSLQVSEKTAKVIEKGLEYSRLSDTSYASHVLMAEDGSALVIGGSSAWRYLP